MVLTHPGPPHAMVLAHRPAAGRQIVSAQAPGSGCGTDMVVLQESGMMTPGGRLVGEQALRVRAGEGRAGASVAANHVVARRAVREMLPAHMVGGKRIWVVHHRAGRMMAADARQAAHATA